MPNDIFPAYTHSLLPVEVDNLSINGNQELAVAIAAQGTLTMDTQPADTNTITIGAITYTFLDIFVDAVDNIFTGADLAAAKLNLLAAVNAVGGTPGTTHFTSQVANPDVSGAAFISDDAIFTAIVAGVAGNSLDTLETFTPVGNVWDAATLGTTRAGNDQGQTFYQAAVLVAEDVAIRINFGAAASTTVGRFIPIGGELRLNDLEIAQANIASTGAAAAVSIVYYR